MVRISGFEPLTPALSARCSNLLSYIRIYKAQFLFCKMLDSNQQPIVYQTIALPSELISLQKLFAVSALIVGTISYDSFTCIIIISNFFIKVKLLLWATSTITTSPPCSDPNGPIPVSRIAVIRRGSGGPRWYGILESNQQLLLRREVFYPLN